MKIPAWTARGTKVPAYPVAIAGYEQIIDSNTGRTLIAPCGEIGKVMRQKSADAIVVEETSRGLNEARSNYETGGLSLMKHRTSKDEPTRSPFHGDEPDRGSQTWTWEPGREREFMWPRAIRQT